MVKFNESMKYSIILPTYNRGNLLKETLDSLINQNFNKFKYEIIIINDNSSDNTEKIVKEYININPKVRYYKNEFNKWIWYNRNLWIKLAKWEYIIQTEDDAKYPKEYLSKIEEEIEKLGDEKRWTIIVNPRKTWNFHEWIVPKLVDFRRKSIDELTKLWKRNIIWWRIYKRDLAKEIWWYKLLKIWEDTEFVQRMKNNWYKSYAIFSTYRLHQEPTTFLKFYVRMYKQWYAYKEYKEEFKSDISFIWKVFWIWLSLFPIFSLLSTIFIGIYGILILFFWFVGLSFINQEIRWMYPLMFKTPKYLYLILFIPLYYLVELYWILAWRIHRSVKENIFLIY